MENKTQERTSRFNEAEYGLLKTLFRDSDELLYLIRKIFFFGGLTEAEIKQAEIFKKEEVFNVLKKTFIPEISETDPYNQVIDTWMTLDLKDKLADEIGVQINARSRTNTMMEDAVNRLKNPSTEKVSVLAFTPVDGDDEENHTALVARNNFISGTSYQLANLKMMSKKDEKTSEELKEEQRKNSSK